MEPRSLILLSACIVMSVTLYVYGYKFLKRNNHILGAEWILVATSAANFGIYWLTEAQASWDLMVYLDAFSRLFGMTFLTMVGMAAATHAYRASATLEVGVFVGSLTATWIILRFEALQPMLPYIYLVIWYVFTLYLIYITGKLISLREHVVAAHLVAAILIMLFIHTIYDFYPIPGDETNLVFNFYFLALAAWTYGFAVIYHAYAALARSTAAHAGPSLINRSI